MVQDPYQVLGIQNGATQDEIKKAYRKKARENHPDLHPNDPEAAKRMNEINEAYDMLMNPAKYEQRRAQEQQRQQAQQQYRQYTGQSGTYGGSPFGSYGSDQSGFGGFDFDDFFGFGSAQSNGFRPRYESGDDNAMRAAVDAINTRQYAQAVSILSGLPSTQRSGRWYYLSALANEGMGNSVLAMEQLQQAIRMEPNRLDYRQALQQMQQYSQAYQDRGNSWGFSMDPNNICMTICLAQLCCRFCCC